MWFFHVASFSFSDSVVLITKNYFLSLRVSSLIKSGSIGYVNACDAIHEKLSEAYKSEKCYTPV